MEILQVYNIINFGQRMIISFGYQPLHLHVTMKSNPAFNGTMAHGHVIVLPKALLLSYHAIFNSESWFLN